jgi:hypothetical protein
VMSVSRDEIPFVWFGKSSGRDKVKRRNDMTVWNAERRGKK